MQLLFANDPIFGVNPVATCVGFFLFGNCVGSFLNVLALRSLKEQSILWPPSYCPNCKHGLSPLDNVPVISWLLLRGKCRYCSAPIHWQYPVVEIITGIIFAAIAFEFLILQINVPVGFKDLIWGSVPNWPYRGVQPDTLLWLGAVFQGNAPDLFANIQKAHGLSNDAVMGLPDFQRYGLALEFFVFASVLIAVTITDFKEKLIPHEITYPAMIVGIIFSTVVRGDFFGTMTGIGASYIIFDFMAFYGLKIYLATHPDLNEDAEVAEQSTERPVEASPAKTVDAGDQPVAGETSQTVKTDESQSENSDNAVVAASDNPTLTSCSPDTAGDTVEDANNEPIEVMGGGDAVLSAVMSAYLGWRLLVLALVIGFIIGTIQGIALLLKEMSRAGLLKQCFIKSASWASVLFLLFAGMTVAMYCSVGSLQFNEALQPALNTGFLGGIGGALLGTVMVGSKVSKPFPFGPALACGGLIAMFLVPYWLLFY
ncbi:MAG: prepilin peptidase [Candidatus Obscuribacterales bacterium]|jgi:prepilin signal peptidase PulO-like enzyme (type II secretory pathway)|nr:prepilin peptidase [Candidatus Obscuribacterales bacterium]